MPMRNAARWLALVGVLSLTGCAAKDMLAFFTGGATNSDQYAMARRSGSVYSLQSSGGPWDSRQPSGAPTPTLAPP